MDFFGFSQELTWSGLSCGLNMGLGTSVRAVAMVLMNSGKTFFLHP